MLWKLCFAQRLNRLGGCYNCVACGQRVEPGFAHQACRYTCGNPECRAVYQKRYSTQADQRRQNNRITQLQLQGVDMVTCAVCNQDFEMIHHSHLKAHGLTVKEYKKLYPDLPTMNARMKQTRGQGALTQSGYLTYQGKEPDQKLYEFLVGCLLGDGSLQKSLDKLNARYLEGASNQQYLKWKYQFLSQYFSCSFNERLSSPHTKTGKRYKGWWLKTKVHPLLTQLHEQWYKESKIVPKEFIEKYFTEISLIVWFCDDGCSSSGVNFYTMAFTDNEVRFLVDLLYSRFGISGSILKNSKDQPFLKLNADSRRKFKEITSRFLIPGMEYKLNF
ncbi:MAG TPA: hypothetical protein V6D12_13375 [Candidatus Obscuribacterales bacterium]